MATEQLGFRPAFATVGALYDLAKLLNELSRLVRADSARYVSNLEKMLGPRLRLQSPIVDFRTTLGSHAAIQGYRA